VKKHVISIIVSLSLILVTHSSIQLSAARERLVVNGASTLSSLFDDEFNGPTLNPRWSWLNEDPTRWSLTAVPGYLQIISTIGDMRRACSAQAKNVLLQDAPPGDFEIQTKLVMNPTANYQLGGLVIFNGGQGVEIMAIENGQVPSNRPWFSVDMSYPAFLRLVKSGDLYTGYYSSDGENWQLVGSVTTTAIPNPKIGVLAFNSCFGNPPDIPANFDYFHVALACEIPFFSQRDGNWQTHPLRGTCSGWCVDPQLEFVTIGRCGCTLTSAAMVFNTYGANTDPPQLSDCMDMSACPFHWNASISCSNGKLSRVSRLGFSWDCLDQELSQNHRPVILGMCKRGTCHLDYDDDPNTHAQTHWVVVVSGRGTDPEYYLVHDPWYKCGANIPLATRSEDWDFVWMGVYEGTVPCSSLTALTPPCVAQGANPQPAQSGSGTANVESSLLTTSYSGDIAPASVISGTVWLYTRTELTMTVEITAASSVGNISEMLIWSDTMSNTTWQSFTPFVWLPVSESVYARFRDNLGNVTDVYSDTINPAGPPNAPFEVFLPLIRR